MIRIVLEQLPVGPIPQTQFPTSSCREQVTIRTPGKMFYPTCSPRKLEPFLPALGVPKPDLPILSNTGKGSAAGIPANFTSTKIMPIKYMEYLSRFPCKNGDRTTY